MLDLIHYWQKWWKQVLIFCGVAITLSVIVSSPAIMKPHFKSQIIFYPANPNAHDRSAFFSERGVILDNFGSKDDINRFLAIANSEELVSYLVDSFNLREHYDIQKQGYFYVNRKFKGNYKAIRNDLGAIELQVLDTNPELAAQIVNAALEYIQKTYKGILLTNKQSTYDILREDKRAKEQEMQVLADSLSALKKNSNYFYDKDGHLIGDEKLRMLDRGFQELSTYVSDLESIANQFAVSMSEKHPVVFIVESASVAEKKSKPTRWLIVLGTAIGAFAAATFLIVFIELLKYANPARQALES